MAIGLGIGLFLIVLGIVCEFVVSHFDTPAVSAVSAMPGVPPVPPVGTPEPRSLTPVA